MFSREFGFLRAKQTDNQSLPPWILSKYNEDIAINISCGATTMNPATLLACRPVVEKLLASDKHSIIVDSDVAPYMAKVYSGDIYTVPEEPQRTYVDKNGTVLGVDGLNLYYCS